ncbi:MAG: universal stress protein [Legionellaceae bacterium]|nr:universal stress protein [Legionellaceae bacterium]
MTLRRILVATDFSRHADYALERAVKIAKECQAALQAVHVIRQGWFGSLFSHEETEGSDDSLSTEKQTVHELFAERMKQYPFDQVVPMTILEGKVTDSLLRYLKEKSPADLVVLGAHGSFYINNYILGTTAGRMAKHSPIPLLLVKHQPEKTYQRIMVAVDFSLISQRIVELAFQYFPEAEFQLIHVADIWYEKMRKNKTNIEGFAEDIHPMLHNMHQKMDEFLAVCSVNPAQFEKKLVGGYAADTIGKLAGQSNMDLLVFGTEGYSALHYFLIGSVAQRLLQLAPCDMLLVPPAEKQL